MDLMGNQGALTKGIYQFSDPSGCLMAARLPQSGPADLYSGTRVIVEPNQTALFIYNGKITEVFPPGNHEVKTENFPILTRLANWQFGFESPLKCEIWFFSGNVFSGRRWGTASPVLLSVPALGTVPIRGYGNFSIAIRDPKAFYLKLIGGRSAFDITEVEEFVQGQILELLPNALTAVKEAKDLNQKQDEISEILETALDKKIAEFGLRVVQIQVLSLLPPKEVLKAMDERVAMDIIGDQKQYLIYKMANSLDQVKGNGAQDPAQLMMGLMLSKSLVGADFRDKERPTEIAAPAAAASCPACRAPLPAGAGFCPKCGSKVSA